MTTLLRERGWLLNLLFILLGAYFLGGALNAVLAQSIRTELWTEEAARVTAGTSPRGSSQFNAVAERNLMGARRERAPDEDQSGTITAGPAPCTLAAAVRATLVAQGAPQWSAVVIHDNTTREAGVYTINEGSNTLAAGALVVAIRTCAVDIRHHDRLERCTCETEAAPAVAPMQTTGGIRKMSATHFRVPRGEVEACLSNLSRCATMVRVVPSFIDNQPAGFKLFSIKPDSIYAKIGLENGDVVRRINGQELDSPDTALEIYRKLKDATSISIELQRRGQHLHLTYAIE